MALSMAGAPINKNVVEVERELAIAYGFVPELFRVQSVHPLVNSAAVRLFDAVLLSEGRLTRSQKKSLLYSVASARGNECCRALHPQALSLDREQSRALHDFALQLACGGLWFSAKDIDRLTHHGFDDQAILEVVVTTAIGQMLCILAEVLELSNDPERSHPFALEIERPSSPKEWEQPAGPYLKCPPEVSSGFEPFSFLRDQLGFIPKLFRAQISLPNLVAAQVHFLEQIVHGEEPLSRIQKEEILLAVSASNLNTYGVALQRQILDGLGVGLEQSDAIVDDLFSASISPADKALLDEVSKLNSTYPRSEACFHSKNLENHGFTKAQTAEAVAVAAFTNFLNTLQFGLGTTPDFPPARIFTAKDLYRSTSEARPTSDGIHAPDPDAELIKQVQDGKVDAFEELVRRHSGRVFGTVAGIVGNLDDARDATQDVFLKAFENIARFEGRAKFSTWLISIAINTGTEMLRHHKNTEPLGDVDDDENFRPRQVQKWTDDPEQIFTAAQRNELVREGILRLPEKYRVALILRDISQLSSEEAAAALEIGVPALKARVLRGRLMLRERLAPHFAHDRERDDA
jgi:RNA polymerase sigma-70 factor, ECF subfamily